METVTIECRRIVKVAVPGRYAHVAVRPLTEYTVRGERVERNDSGQVTSVPILDTNKQNVIDLVRQRYGRKVRIEFACADG